MTTNLKEKMKKLSPKRRKRVKERTKEIINSLPAFPHGPGGGKPTAKELDNICDFVGRKKVGKRAVELVKEPISRKRERIGLEWRRIGRWLDFRIDVNLDERVAVKTFRSIYWLAKNQYFSRIGKKTAGLFKVLQRVKIVKVRKP